MKAQISPGRDAWLPAGHFEANIGSRRNLQVMNEQALIPIYFDAVKSGTPSIKIAGSQSPMVSLWEMNSFGSCIKTPKPQIDLVTLHFITSGHATFRCRNGDVMGSATSAVLTRFDTLRERRSADLYGSIGGAFAPDTLIALNRDLTGADHPDLPAFSTQADVTAMGIRTLFCTMTQIYRRSRELRQSDDLVFSLLQEILGYQLLSAWPRDTDVRPEVRGHARPDRLDTAKQFIQANLASKIRLSDIASAAALSVRTLQDTFRRQEDLTPFEYIIRQRLLRVHQALISRGNGHLSIRDIAAQWGFVHMSDFGQRYRHAFGCTPTETRRNAE